MATTNCFQPSNFPFGGEEPLPNISRDIDHNSARTAHTGIVPRGTSLFPGYPTCTHRRRPRSEGRLGSPILYHLFIRAGQAMLLHRVIQPRLPISKIPLLQSKSCSGVRRLRRLPSLPSLNGGEYVCFKE